MVKDPRYKAIRSLIQSKGISSLQDVFTIIPLTVVKKDIKINYNTLRNRVNRPETLTTKNLIGMAALFEVDPVDVFRLAVYDINSRSKSKKRQS